MILVNYPRLSRVIAGAIPVALLGMLSACVTPPPRTYAVPAPPPQRVFRLSSPWSKPRSDRAGSLRVPQLGCAADGVDERARMPALYERVIVSRRHRLEHQRQAAPSRAPSSFRSSLDRAMQVPAWCFGGVTGPSGSAADANAQQQARQTAANQRKRG